MEKQRVSIGKQEELGMNNKMQVSKNPFNYDDFKPS